jgi:hypothetical protein
VSSTSTALANSSFSAQLPALQLAWDSVSSGAFKKCPRFYELSIVQSWRSREDNVHLTFGILLHEARELYAKLRAKGFEHDDAVTWVVTRLMNETWDEQLDRPWQGSEQKNRYTLIMSVVWLLDKLEDDPLTTMLYDNGRPMVEVSFRFSFGQCALQTGEEYVLCGHLDRVAEYGPGGPVWINDTKTTKATLSEDSAKWFFMSFSPDNQVSLYTFASQIVLPRRAEGVLIDGVQVAQTFSRHARAPVTRTKSQIDEWLVGFRLMLVQAESYAEHGFWPMNEAACFNCAFRGVCSLPPAERPARLARDFVKRVWDPLRVRGE